MDIDGSIGVAHMREELMRTAVEMAVHNVRSGTGGPFAALVVEDGHIVGEGTNRVTIANDPTAHAEMLAIRSACEALDTFLLQGCELYTTCEPCPMCLGAVYWSRIHRVYYAATRKDAREAGFDDEDIYAEVVRPLSERRIEMVQALPEAAAKAFDAWAAQTDRVPY